MWDFGSRATYHDPSAPKLQQLVSTFSAGLDRSALDERGKVKALRSEWDRSSDCLHRCPKVDVKSMRSAGNWMTTLRMLGRFVPLEIEFGHCKLILVARFWELGMNM